MRITRVHPARTGTFYTRIYTYVYETYERGERAGGKRYRFGEKGRKGWKGELEKKKKIRR